MRVCIDDFALKKREKYGTLMVDIETHKLLDMIPSRDLEDVTKWLKTYPNISLVSRDGSVTYRKAITKAHPNALQVSDRFHLFKNLTDYGKDYLKKKLKVNVMIPATTVKETQLTPDTKENKNRRLTLKAKYNQLRIRIDEGMKKNWICEELNMDIRTYHRLEALSPEEAEHYFTTLSEQRSQEKLLVKIELIQEIRCLKQQGYTKSAIAGRTGLSPKTITKYLKPDFNPIHGSVGLKKRSELNPYETQIQDSLSRGMMASIIEKEMREQGYKGSSSLIRRFCSNWKKKQLQREIKDTADNESQEYIERKHIFKLLYHPVKTVKAITEKQYEQLLASVPDFEKVHSIIWSFKKLVMEQRHEDLEQWIKEAKQLEIGEIQSFVNGMERDLEAVRNAIEYKYSNGLAEGTVNKIKGIKRIMYGRCSFETLRIKSLRLEKMRKSN